MENIRQFVATKAFINFKGKILVLRESTKYSDGTNSGKYDVVQFSQCMCSLHYTLRYSETACQGFAHDYAIPVGAVSTSAFINFYFFPAHLVQQRMWIKPAAPVSVFLNY